LPLLEAVDLGDRAVLKRALQPVVGALEPVESPLDRPPAGGDQLDEEREVLDAGASLRVEVALEPFEAADRLAGEPAHFGEVPRDRNDLGAHAVLDRGAQPLRHARLEFGCSASELVERGASALERSSERRAVRRARARFGDSRAGPVERLPIHGPDCSPAVGHARDQPSAGTGPTRPGLRSGILNSSPMRTDELDYDLPAELIAQQPPARRDHSRLLVYERASGAVRHRRFTDLPDELGGDYLIVVNDTRVVPARLRVQRPGGGEAELLLLEPVGEALWEALARPSRKLRPGMRLGAVELVEHRGEGRWVVQLDAEPAGEPPLPPYIHERLDDPERYQTVYAHEAGSAAAPTAGLHFTPELLARLDVERITLHVGLDTFRPIAADTLAAHPIHSERYSVGAQPWERIGAAERVCAIGTTTVRVLESLARGAPLEGRTELFVTPGFEFRRVDALVTNFHLPRSTLLALVMAFAGVEETRRLYRTAIQERYRFYSFGDAMLVL
jgi:S-adenosylmethionine:tRNA ribosyltransferase-isomerase